MRQLPTPLFTPIKADSLSRSVLSFWQVELERYDPERILQWTMKMFGFQTAVASAWCDEDAAIQSLLEKNHCRLRAVDRMHPLLLHETWAPLSPGEAARETFDGRTAGPALWARFHVEHLCKRYEKTIRRYRTWIVPARREQDAALATIPVLSWSERFGVFRVAPLACCRTKDVRERIRRHTAAAYDPFSRGPGSDADTGTIETPNDETGIDRGFPGTASPFTIAQAHRSYVPNEEEPAIAVPFF